MSFYNRKFTIAGFALAAALTLSPVTALAQAAPDAQIQTDAQHQLKGSRFSGVHIEVQNGVVHLTGQVARFSDKEDAGKRVQKMHEASNVQNEIEVAGGGNVSDEQLMQKLAKGLVYDRQGYGTQVFNNLGVQVHNGVVLVTGMVVNPVDKDSALDLVKNTAGVRDVIDKIQVAPVSPMDNRIRRDEERAVYGTPQLNRYALNPAKPIRIVVVNGHVTLEGVVDTKGDRDIAGLRANGVPGVFSVQNNLQVANQTEH
jgi:osmotically-inducible protein OsmY